jgi:hypothetical protein
MILPQNYLDVWSGIFKDLHDPIVPAKFQSFKITNVIDNNFLKSRCELFLSSNAGFAQHGPTKRSQVELKSQPFQKKSIND